MRAEFIKSIKGTDPITNDGRFQIAFIGRSNVGKSSVINSLLGTKNLVRSSSTPGQTRLINFFLVDNSFYLVDLPGYGYAKMSLTEREKLAHMMRWYLLESEADIRVTVLVVDAQIGLRVGDREVLEALREKNHRILILANKSDRLTQKERARKERELCMDISGSGREKVMFYSAKTARGKEKVWEEIIR